MSSVTFRRDLEPLTCNKCLNFIFGGQILFKKLYCNTCANGLEVLEYSPVEENEEKEEDKPEVNFQENV